MKTLGVIGGLGPMATAFFMQMVIEMTSSGTDQEHIEMLIHNCPSIPDRTSYILGTSKEDPSIPMIQIGRRLAENGAQVIAIPCITANYFFKQMEQAIPVPIINIIEETAEYLVKNQIHSVGLMATDGTVQSALFQNTLQEHGIRVILPDEEGQQDVMHLIYENVKATKPVEMNRFNRVSDDLRSRGADVIILGCTELSMIRRDEKIGPGYLDAMQLLAMRAVETCGKLKEEYRCLITR